MVVGVALQVDQQGVAEPGVGVPRVLRLDRLVAAVGALHAREAVVLDADLSNEHEE